MRKNFYLLLSLFLLGDTIVSFSPTYSIEIEDASYEIVGREDLMGRNQYLQLLTADPKTGLVPSGMRQAELKFDQKLRLETSAFRSQQLTIESAGPTNVGGRTRAVAFDIRDENIILAGGVSGGIWKSIDGGLTWIRKSDPEIRNSVTCIVQDIRAGREDTWYYGTGEIVGNSARGGGAPFRGDGIYKSTDNGESWNPIVSTQDGDPNLFNSQFQYIWNIELNPLNTIQDEVLVAAFGGILRSIDGGDSWNAVLGQALFDLGESVDLNESNASFYTSLERSEANVFYAALSTTAGSDGTSPEAGLYYSVDGVSWNDITPLTDESQYRRTVIGISPSNPDIAYFMIDSNPILILEHRLSLMNSSERINGFDPTPRQVPESELPLGGVDTQTSYNMMVRVHPENPDIVFIGATNLFRSTDGFRTQENITWIGGYNPEGGSSTYPGHHPDQHDLLFLPSNPNVALSASDGGLRESQSISADSVIWESRNNGFITSQFFTIAQSKVPGDQTMLGGMQDNGTDLTAFGSLSWGGVIGGDGGYAATTNDNTLWFASFQRGQTLRLTLNSEFNITSFGRVDPGSLVSESGSTYLFINPFSLDPNNQNRMFCAGGNHLYFNPNVSQIPGGSQIPSGLGWSRVNETPIDNALISAVDISFDSERVYFGTSGGQLFRLDNANSKPQFSLVNITSSAFPESGYISSISINPEDNLHILVGFSNYNIPSIFESSDGGQTFADVSGNLEENPDGSGSGPSIRWVEIIPKNTGNLYLVGTSIGLYGTESLSGASTTWVKESEDLMGSAIVTMMDYRTNDGNLAIATHGNGIFTSQIDDFKSINLEIQPNSLFQVVAAYPNPFLESTQIQYTIPENGDVRIDILSANGNLINTILWAPQYAGTNTAVWDGNTPSGYPLANGIYFYRIRYAGQSKVGRVLLRR